MRHRGRLLTTLIIIGILSSVVLPSVNAEVFDIGTKVSESDLDDNGYKLVYFDSGSRIYTEPDFINYTPSIFDGNESTGLDHDFGPGHDLMWVVLNFPYAYYVSNITIKPTFGGSTTNYTIYILIGEVYTPMITFRNSTEKAFQINGKITGISLLLYSEGTNHFYFNDVIINYTSTPTNLTEVIAAINILTNTVNSLQNQINNLTWQIDVLNNMISEMNNTINELNQTQLQILDNITNIWSSYNQLNSSIINLIKEIENLNITTNENITLIKNDLTLIGTDIYNLHQSMENLTNNVTELSKIQVQINKTTQDIHNLNQNITEIKNTMPSEYDDTILTNRVFQLESENAALSLEIENLTTEIEKLKDAQDEQDDPVAYGGFVFSILAILIAVVAIILATRKLGEQAPSPDKEESEDLTTPEKNDK
jgi:prefoldin subunit 5